MLSVRSGHTVKRLSILHELKKQANKICSLKSRTDNRYIDKLNASKVEKEKKVEELRKEIAHLKEYRSISKQITDIKRSLLHEKNLVVLSL